MTEPTTADDRTSFPLTSADDLKHLPKPATSLRDLDVFISAGDASGDAHGSEVVECLRRLVPGVRVRGIGGPHLRASGVDLAYDSSRWSVIGPVEAAKLVPYLILKFRQVVRLLRDDPPDALLPIDFGGFNARLARAGKRLGIPVLYYFPPRSWAKEGRIGLGIAEIADRVATPFSWSAERLTEAGANAEWVGHPLLERAVASKPVSKLRTEFGCSEQDAPGPGDQTDSSGHSPSLRGDSIATAARLLPALSGGQYRWFAAGSGDAWFRHGDAGCHGAGL